MSTPAERRVAFTRVAHAVESRCVFYDADVADVIDYVEHMRQALGRIETADISIDEAKHTARMARLGEPWNVAITRRTKRKKRGSK